MALPVLPVPSAHLDLLALAYLSGGCVSVFALNMSHSMLELQSCPSKGFTQVSKEVSQCGHREHFARQGKDTYYDLTFAEDKDASPSLDWRPI